MKLTKRAVETAAPPEDRKRWIWLGDDEVPGFGCKVYGTGRRVFALRYRTRRGGRLRMLRIGSFGELTVQQARDIARREKVRVIDGADPQAERQRKRQAAKLPTVTKLMDRWLTDYAKPNRRSWRTDESRMKKHILPALGRYAPEDLTAGPLRRLLDLGHFSRAAPGAIKILRDEGLLLTEVAEAVDSALAASSPEDERRARHHADQERNEAQAAELQEARDRVDAWLAEVLKDGPVQRDRIYRRAKAEGIALTGSPHGVDLAAARTRLGVTPLQREEDGTDSSWWGILADRDIPGGLKRIDGDRLVSASTILG